MIIIDIDDGNLMAKVKSRMARMFKSGNRRQDMSSTSVEYSDGTTFSAYDDRLISKYVD